MPATRLGMTCCRLRIYDPYGLTPSPDVSLPYRISTTGTEWSATGDPNLVDGIDGAHYFRFACSTRRGIQENSADTPLFECCPDTGRDVYDNPRTPRGRESEDNGPVVDNGQFGGFGERIHCK